MHALTHLKKVSPKVLPSASPYKVETVVFLRNTKFHENMLQRSMRIKVCIFHTRNTSVHTHVNTKETVSIFLNKIVILWPHLILCPTSIVIHISTVCMKHIIFCVKIQNTHIYTYVCWYKAERSISIVIVLLFFHDVWYAQSRRNASCILKYIHKKHIQE